MVFLCHGQVSGFLAALAFLVLTATSASAACPASPRPLCRDLAQTNISINATSADFRWKATRGPSTSIEDFGDPRGATSYSICAWDDGNLVLDAAIPPAATCDGVSCWRDKGTRGLRYRNKTEALRSLDLLGSTMGRSQIRLRGSLATSVPLPWTGHLTVQLLREDSVVCFESAAPASAFSKNDDTRAIAKATLDADSAIPPLASSGCGLVPAPYTPGISTTDEIVHDGRTRTFRVYLPPSYDSSSATPLVFLLHGGFGSGAQAETSSRMLEAAARGFVVIAPDGVLSPGGIRTWNAGSCCGYAASQDIDDVGFLAAVLDHVESRLCVDTRRVYATGMSNGSGLSHRLGCDLANRIRAIATVAGTDMTTSCAPARPLAQLTIHGSDDPNIPYNGGLGCGLAGVPFRSVPSTVALWRERDDCNDTATSTSVDGEATCTVYDRCAAGTEVQACILAGGGHQWPGGDLPAGTIGSCNFTYQSQQYSASERILDFFELHPKR